MHLDGMIPKAFRVYSMSRLRKGSSSASSFGSTPKRCRIGRATKTAEGSEEAAPQTAVPDMAGGDHSIREHHEAEVRRAAANSAQVVTWTAV